MQTIDRVQQKSRPSDEVIATAERLINRLSGMQTNLADLRARVSGDQPPAVGGGAEAASAFAVSGFVGNAGQALERAHSIVGAIETTITEIADVI